VWGGWALAWATTLGSQPGLCLVLAHEGADGHHSPPAESCTPRACHMPRRGGHAFVGLQRAAVEPGRGRAWAQVFGFLPRHARPPPHLLPAWLRRPHAARPLPAAVPWPLPSVLGCALAVTWPRLRPSARACRPRPQGHRPWSSAGPAAWGRMRPSRSCSGCGRTCTSW
jgi:hypothetical protein